VALILLVGLLFFFLSGPSEDVAEKPDDQIVAGEVEKAETLEPAEEESSRPEQPGEDSEFPDLPDLGNLRDFDPEAIFDQVSDSSDKPEEKEPDKTAAKEGEPAQPAPERGPQAEAPAAGQMEAAEPPGEKPQPEKPTPDNKEPEKKPPEKKPAEKKPKPKPPPPDPLRGLPESLDLPEVSLKSGSAEGAAEPITLGTIQSGPDVEWQLYLLGGENAVKGTRAFVLEQQETDPAKAKWRVQLETPKASGEPTREDVAELWRDGDALHFQWVSDPVSSANNLRNCILQVRVSGKSKYLTLTQPKMVDPIPIDLDRGLASVSVPVKWMPDNVRVQITKVQGRQGHVTEPAEPADAKTPVILSFPRTDRHGNTADRVAFRMNFTPRATAMQVKLQMTEPPREAFRALQGTAEMQRTHLETMAGEVNDKLKPKRGEPPRGTERSRLSAQLDEIEMQMWYVNFYLEVQGSACIHYRVYTEVDGREVLLVATQPAESPVAADSNDPPKT
jgi:hypothetical protein